jgi:hypothetical protein
VALSVKISDQVTLLRTLQVVFYFASLSVSAAWNSLLEIWASAVAEPWALQFHSSSIDEGVLVALVVGDWIQKTQDAKLYEEDNLLISEEFRKYCQS